MEDLAGEEEMESGLGAGESSVQAGAGTGESGRGLDREAAGLLHQLGYAGPLSQEDCLKRSTTSGATCQDFTSLCVWLVSELKAVATLEENVNPTDGPEDAETFQLEMSGVVSELHCPYSSLTTGDVTSRLTSPQNCLQLLVFLSTELQAARILKRKRVSDPPPGAQRNKVLQELRLICEATGLPEPFLDLPVAEFMEALDSTISKIVSTIPETAKSSSLLTTHLEPRQWEILKELHQSMIREYECRMRMLVTRFDVTVKSFHWSERAKVQGDAMHDAFWPLRQSLPTQSRITLSHLLAAREDDSRLLATCNASFCQKTRSAINKVMMIGHVPDRGGRPNEIEPPMPTWEKRREGGGRGGGQQRWGKRNKKRRN